MKKERNEKYYKFIITKLFRIIYEGLRMYIELEEIRFHCFIVLVRFNKKTEKKKKVICN